MASRKKPKATAVYRAGYSAPVAPQVAQDELERIRAKHRGVVRPADVVEESRPEDADLHPVFTWDDYAAAEKWREDEARRLIRNVCVVYEGQPDDAPPSPVYIHVRPAEGPDEPGYRTVAHVRTDAGLAEMAERDALAQLRGWVERYRWVAALADVRRTVEDVLDRRSGKAA